MDGKDSARNLVELVQQGFKSGIAACKSDMWLVFVSLWHTKKAAFPL